MKINDTTGRSLLVDLVYKHPQMGWLQAPSFQLKGRSTQHVRLPHGQYALRVCSLTGADVLLFENARKRVETGVPARTQFIEFDNDRNALEFRPAGSELPETCASDIVVANASTDNETATADGAQSDASAEPQVPFLGPQAPAGHGLVFAVVRFAKENTPYGEPPQEEFELAFQMHEPGAFEEMFAQNLHQVVQAPDLPNPLDPLSHEPSAPADRPSFHCHFSGCKH